ncbi:MAG: NifB/NifX family molybdenum-iron cluster-binding protein, partial [Methanogenium sp.]|nr:NifB/NifX family molybdenum-iron cluster-binding protein [Methanogenium sp.]
LADHGANIVIAGGMGPKAVELFHANDIEVILGVTGTIKNALESFITGKLESGENVCHH